MRKIIKFSFVLAMLLLITMGLTGCILDIIIPPIENTCDHEWQDATCTEPYRCSLCGLTDGSPLGHYWLKATCATPEMCARCGEKHGEPLDHDWSKPTCTEPATCYMCGVTNGRPNDHKWSTPTCTEPAYCYHCGETDGEPKGHNLVSATCISDGYCSTCGEILEPINENAHDMEGNKCIICGESFYPTISVSSATYSKSSGYDTVTIVVSIEENPGVLGMLLTFQYSATAMELISIENGSALYALDFNIFGNAVMWENMEISPDDVIDGDILVLTFRIIEKTNVGSYNVNVEVNSAYDNNLKSLNFKIVNGTITVTD